MLPEMSGLFVKPVTACANHFTGAADVYALSYTPGFVLLGFLWGTLSPLVCFPYFYGELHNISRRQVFFYFCFTMDVSLVWPPSWTIDRGVTNIVK